MPPNRLQPDRLKPDRLQPDRLTLRRLLRDAESLLLQSPHPQRARADAELLLRHLLQQDKAWLIAHTDEPVPDQAALELDRLLRRRLTGEPVQYILGQAEFFGLTLAVDPAALIPRPETELLVERVLTFLRTRSDAQLPPRVLDIGTGSGAIAIALAVSCPAAEIVAVDLSPGALRLAGQNAARHRVADRITFLESDLFAAFAEHAGTAPRFDCIVSNPPYVPLADAPTLAIEVRDHEPALALFAGDDGLDLYRRLIPAALDHLHPGGLLALEFGFGQQDSIAALLGASGFQQIEILPDYQQIPRIATAVQPRSRSQAGSFPPLPASKLE